jgi:peptidoglycan hydrolase-like protein with peptidoglycan-binding domain/3D (Asp-Asp-Asp) domain-containing protein
MHTHKTAILLSAFVLSLLPFPAIGAASVADKIAMGQPFEQQFVLTAYYSPLPDQCCYVLGSLIADQEMNGMGVAGADGTKVYAGMVAAPPSLPFGTRLSIDGLGVVTVHDRGGAIQEQNGIVRIDVWAGFGEEGLARALAFGVKRLTGTIYPITSPQPDEKFNLADLPAPPERIRPYFAESTTLFDVTAAAGDHTASTEFLQERLADIGYFSDRATGSFGPVTQKSLEAFYRDMNLDEPSDRLTENGAAAIEAAYARRDALEPIAAVVEPSSSPDAIEAAKRTLRFLDAFDGRTTGTYDEGLRQAVIAFQKSNGIIASDGEAGAGRIGPKTRQKIVLLWRRKHVEIRSERLLAARKIDQVVADRGYDVERFLSKGDSGEQVRRLQRFLEGQGYLPKGSGNGTFGTLTLSAVITYQTDRGIVASADADGAGVVGPATLLQMRRDTRATLMQVVRAKGWAAI